ncbi:MAG: M48 family metalloprotease [Thermoleophilaceae bacterium]
MGGHRFKVSAAVAVAVVAAGAATLLLRPRGAGLEPVAVEVTAYFSAGELARAEAFRGPQRVLGIAGMLLSTGALALVALRPPGPLRSVLGRAGARPVLGAAAVGAAGSVAFEALGLPLGAIAHARSVEFGLSTQGYGAWLGDVGKATAVGAVMTAGLAAGGVALARRFPRRWWIPASASVVAVGVVLILLSPVLIEPLFNRFEPLPPGELRDQVLDLARRSGVDVGEVYRVDASRRTTGANAYVGGLGPTKRVVLYDNLIEGFPRDQLLSVVAHELGHQQGRDLYRGLLWLALVAPAGALLAQRLAEAMTDGRPRRGSTASASHPGRSSLGTPAGLPALALALALVSFFLGTASNALSRRVEARADLFALELTREPSPFIALERGLAVRNVSDPTPPAVLHLLFGTHPTTLERIGYGVEWKRRTPG